MTAGDGERACSRLRSCVPKVQAVSAVKEGKMRERSSCSIAAS